MAWNSLVILTSLWLADPVLSGPSQAESTKTVADQQTLQNDLKSLEDTEFRHREAAARRLVARGVSAVEPLADLASSGSLESSVRSFELLRRLYRDGDDETFEAVESAYERLTRSDSVLTAARAEAAVDSVAEIRHRRALAAFRKLGGVVRFVSDEPIADDAPIPPIKYAMINRKWAGYDDGLKYIRRIEDFRSPIAFQRIPPLYVIDGSKVTEAGLTNLQANLPNLQITNRGPACLGVQSFDGEACEVAGIERGSAADRAGLQTGDIILRFNGVVTPNFKSLVDQIKNKEPGDKVPVIYLRDGEELSATVELGEWK